MNMNTVLHWVTLAAGIVMVFFATWGLVIAGSMTTVELQEFQFWHSVALFAGGVGLLSTGAARLRTH